MKDFFISYNKDDRMWAEWIAWTLEEEEYTVYLDIWDTRPGFNFVLEMNRASIEAERTILVISPSFFKSKYTPSEWAVAFKKDPTGEKGTILPIIVREYDLEGLLGTISYVKLIGLNKDEAGRRLLAGIKPRRAKPIEEPEYPGRQIPSEPPFPGTLPGKWNVPPRNPNFTGREGYLDNLDAALKSGKAAALTQTITGLGGIGKTELAKEYAYRRAGEYSLVWWIASEEPVKLASDYAELAKRIGLPEADNPNQPEVIRAVRRWLEGHTGWLLIFDNVPKPEALHDYIPRNDSRRVVITSQHLDWSGTAASMGVEIFTPGESVKFLLKRTGLDDTAGAEKLAEALGHFPLALAQAGAYISAKNISIAEYCDMYERYKGEVLNRVNPPEGYDATIATTWTMSFEAVERESPAGADMLKLLAFLAPDDIPLEIIRAGAEFLPKKLAEAAGKELDFLDAVGSLTGYSLIDKSGDAVYLHRLVQEVVRDRMDDAEKKMWAEAAVKIVNKAFLFKEYQLETWAESKRLLPQAVSAAGYGAELGVALEETGRLLNNTGLYLDTHANFAEAKRHYERALEIDREVYGENHPEVAIRLNNLGEVLRAMGKFEEAKGHFERALEIDREVYGENHPDVAIRLNNLGLVLREMGELEAAKGYFERALEIFIDVFGKKDPNVATTLNNLGSVLKDMDELEAAKGYFESALEIDWEVYGENHPNVAIRLNNLGIVLREMGELEAAKGYFERALEIDREVYGENHPKVAIRLNNLGEVLRAMGKFEEAKGHFERALEIDREVYGANHPDVAIRLNNLGSVLQEMGELEAAKEHYERALEIDMEVYGDNHPDVAIYLNNLGLVLNEMGELEAAKGYFERALEIDSEVYGENHPDVAIDLNNLGSVLREMGELEAAKGHFERALEMIRGFFRDDHPKTKIFRENLEGLNREMRGG